MHGKACQEFRLQVGYIWMEKVTVKSEENWGRKLNTFLNYMSTVGLTIFDVGGAQARNSMVQSILINSNVFSAV